MPEPEHVDDSIKRLIARSFAQAGAWAILSGLLILGVGYQANWFIQQFVTMTARTMDKLVESDIKLQDLISANRALLERSILTTEKVVKLMEDAEKTMHAVPEERQKQTELLEEIRSILESTERRVNPETKP